jgi:polysaccharide deacetylase family protein (PEP-CTERM system associated)
MQNMLTIDVEEWYHLNYASMQSQHHVARESRVRANTQLLLDILAESDARATFFFLGSVAERDPALVRDVGARGHEIASHGYGHELVYSQTPDEFATDVKRSLDILRDITGQPVLGYRAPSWSVSHATPWAFETLAELGLRYSSSVFPFTTYLYGDSRAPLLPFVRRLEHGRCLYEVPATVLSLGRMRLPFGGGFYFRAMPLWLTRLATHLVNRRGQAVVFYLHPREIDPAQPRLPLPVVDYLVTYVNLAATAPKLRRLVRLVPSVTIQHYLERHAEARCS